MKFKLLESIKNNLILYHGWDPRDGVQQIDKSKFGSYDDGYLGHGFYLTDSKEYAAEYGTVASYKVNITNPLYISNLDYNTAKKLAQQLCEKVNYKITDNLIYVLKRRLHTDKYNQTIATPEPAAVVQMFAELLMNNHALFEGFLMDYSLEFTDIILELNYDAVIFSTKTNKYYEVVIFNPSVVTELKNDTVVVTEQLIKDVQQCLRKNFQTKFDYNIPSAIVFQDGLIISAQCHPDIMSCLYENNILKREQLGTDDKSGSNFLAQKLNCLRMTMCGAVGENYVALPSEKISSDQVEKLLDWLYIDMSHARIEANNRVDIVFDGKSQFKSQSSKIYSFYDYMPEDIIKDIKRNQ